MDILHNNEANRKDRTPRQAAEEKQTDRRSLIQTAITLFPCAVAGCLIVTKALEKNDETPILTKDKHNLHLMALAYLETQYRLLLENKGLPKGKTRIAMFRELKKKIHTLEKIASTFNDTVILNRLENLKAEIDSAIERIQSEKVMLPNIRLIREDTVQRLQPPISPNV